jgi:hypothetical protein
MIATKFVPMVSIWEIKEARDAVQEVADRVATYSSTPGIPGSAGGTR